MKIRLTLKMDEVSVSLLNIQDRFNVLSCSRAYPQTRHDKNSQFVSIYLDVEPKPISYLDKATKFLKLNTDRTAEVSICDGGLLPFIYKSIGCECFEVVHIGYDYILIVDECGKVCEPSKILNPAATFLYSGKSFDYIAGDVLVAKTASVNGERDIVGLSNDEIGAISMVLKSQHLIKGFKQ